MLRTLIPKNSLGRSGQMQAYASPENDREIYTLPAAVRLLILLELSLSGRDFFVR